MAACSVSEDVSAEAYATYVPYFHAIDGALSTGALDEAAAALQSLHAATEAGTPILEPTHEFKDPRGKSYAIPPPQRLRLAAAIAWRTARLRYLRGSAAARDASCAKAAGTSSAEHFKAAMADVQRSLELYEAEADAHKLAGSLCAKSASGMSEKIGSAYKIREHISRAIELNPADATAEFILGAWCYKVASLDWVSRRIASTFFATPPTSSYEEAVEHLNKAEAISTSATGFGPILTARLTLAQCHEALGAKAEAAKWAGLAAEVPPAAEEDPEDMAALVKMLHRYKLPVPPALASTKA